DVHRRTVPQPVVPARRPAPGVPGRPATPCPAICRITARERVRPWAGRGCASIFPAKEKRDPDGTLSRRRANAATKIRHPCGYPLVSAPLRVQPALEASDVALHK